VRDIGERDHVRSPFGSAPMLPQTLNVRKRTAQGLSSDTISETSAR
jgi:hypothetical protein